MWKAFVETEYNRQARKGKCTVKRTLMDFWNLRLELTLPGRINIAGLNKYTILTVTLISKICDCR